MANERQGAQVGEEMNSGGRDKPVVDVLLPAAGGLPWAEATLCSLSRQTQPADIVTLIDDGVEDRKRLIGLGNRYLGTRFRIIENRGKGISAALNTGVTQSDSLWIARMDCDDVAHPERLAKQLSWLTPRADDVVACGTQVWLIDTQGRRLQRSQYPEGHEAIQAQRLERSCFAHPTLMVRRDALLQVPYRSALDGAEDVDLMLRLGERWRVGNLSEALLDYRIHAGQVAHAYRARQTALQELGFRLAELRAAQEGDVLDASPQLAEAFVNWRLADPGYANARQALTGIRYLMGYLRGASFSAAASCARQTLAAQPWRRDTRRWIRRLMGTTPGGVRHDALPASLAVLALPEQG